MRWPGSFPGRRRGMDDRRISCRIEARCFTGRIFRRKLRRLGVKTEVRGDREEGLDRADREAVEDAEGHARPALAAAAGGRRLDGEGRAGTRPLRALPPASGAWRSDAGRDLLREDAVAPVRDPASSRQAGRRPDGLPFRVEYLDAERCCRYWFEKQPEGESRRSATGAGVVDVCALGTRATTKPLVCTRQDGPQFPLRPYSLRERRRRREIGSRA